MRDGTASVRIFLPIAAVLIALFIALVMIPSSDAEVLRDSGSGPCGDDLHWAVNLNGTLSIYGSGDSWDYADLDNPLEPYKDMITLIKIDFGVTSVDPDFLAPCQNVKWVEVGRDMKVFWFESKALEEVTLKKRIGDESDHMEQFAAGFGNNLVSVFEEDLIRLAKQDAEISFKHLRGTDIPVDLRTTVGYDSLYEFRVGDLTELETYSLISIFYEGGLHFKIMHLQPDYLMDEGLYQNYNITFSCDEPGYILLQVQKKAFIPYPEVIGAALVIFFTLCGYIYYKKVLRGIES